MLEDWSPSVSRGGNLCRSRCRDFRGRTNAQTANSGAHGQIGRLVDRSIRRSAATRLWE